MMIDFVSGFVEPGIHPARPLFDSGKTLRISRHGEVEQLYSNVQHVAGSFDTRLSARSPNGSSAYVTGNPVKHFQGHNLFGPIDAEALYFSAGARFVDEQLFPTREMWEEYQFSGPRFTRLDFTRSYRFASPALAREWLRDVAASARIRYGSGTLQRSGGVQFGAGSTRWSLTCYHKGDEVSSRKKGHALPPDLPGRSALVEWAQGVVRFEFRVRGPELETLDLSALSPLDVWNLYYSRVTWNRNASMKNTDLQSLGLPPRLLGVYAIWMTGVDMRALYTHDTYYRHRRALLQKVGVDIATPPPPALSAGQRELDLDSSGWDPAALAEYSWQPSPHNYPTLKATK